MLVSRHPPRHNRAVRVVFALLASMAVMPVASAHPVRDDPFDDLDPGFKRPPSRPRRPVHIPTPEEQCERNKSWSKLVKCLSKAGAAVATLQDLGSGRLVSVKASTTIDAASVYLYVQKDGRWQRMPAFFQTNPTSELLSFSRLKTEKGYRVEQGLIYKSAVLVGERIVGMDQARVQISVRRQSTSICLDNGVCQTVITACDALVDGKTRWSFRGKLLIDHGFVRISGDPTFAGQACAPAPSQLSTVGDPLE